MLFNSFQFLFIFLPITALCFFLLGRKNQNHAIAWLAIASLTFYSIWDYRFTPILITSILVNFTIGKKVNPDLNPRTARQWLIAGITFNLLGLGVFKYTNFFTTTINSIFGLGLPILDIELPLGISFFTFTQIAFLVDSHKKIAHEYKISHYFLFVTYFPHLIAGPVLHHKQMMPQFRKKENFRFRIENFNFFITLFVIGLTKKVIIADSFSEYADPVFLAASAGNEIRFFSALTGTLGYTFQLYFDFSGYSDMAIALSMLFGIHLPINFNSPYKSPNIIEFWRRWHMTLSTFLRDYLYIPLGGNRLGKLRRHINLFLTMLLGGLWHGANWTFVIWGALHGLFLIVNHVWHEIFQKTAGPLPHSKSSPLFTFASTILTFTSVSIAWIFFRADSINSAMLILEGLVGRNGFNFPFLSDAPLNRTLFNDVGMSNSPQILIGMTVAAIGILTLPNSQEIMKYDASVSSQKTFQYTVFRGLILGIMLLLCLMAFLNSTSKFLYFQF